MSLDSRWRASFKNVRAFQFKSLLILFLIIFANSVFSLETIDKMRSARNQIREILDLSSEKGQSVDVIEIEKRFNEVLSGQLEFCKRSVAEINEYFIKESTGEIDAQKIKNSCILSIRRWHINTETNLFKLKRIDLKSRLEKSLKRLKAIEQERLEFIINSYKNLI